MVTIKQIALRAGVSPTTVSNVLNGNLRFVSGEVASRVRSVIEETGYISNRGAIMLAHGISRTIGVILNCIPRDTETVLEDPFEGALLGALNREICRRGYYMMLQTTEKPRDVIRLAETWKLDGLIILGIQADDCSIIRRHNRKPIVFIDCYFNDDGQLYHNVGLEDETGSYRLTKYLISCGHRNIAFLSDSSVFEGINHMRYRGFRRALDEAGIHRTERELLQLSRKKKERLQVLEDLCRSPGVYTALCYMSDYYAAEAISWFAEKGIRVPRDISITGFDDNIFSRIITPPLTTVHQDVIGRGTAAVELLFRLLDNETVEFPVVRFPAEPVIRQSVGKIN